MIHTQCRRARIANMRHQLDIAALSTSQLVKLSLASLALTTTTTSTMTMMTMMMMMMMRVVHVPLALVCFGVAASSMQKRFGLYEAHNALTTPLTDSPESIDRETEIHLQDDGALCMYVCMYVTVYVCMCT